jgi:putative Ca2+/H+ antiporter (TMEM165/GDT1 family)
MRYSRIVVFVGAIGALALMTVLSAAIGFALPNIISPQYTFYAAAGLFMFFGSRLLKEAYDMFKSGSTGPSEELEETEAELTKKDEQDPESGQSLGSLLGKSNLRVMTSAFSITFLAEWGDRSQIATIALAAAKDPIGGLILLLLL